MGETMPRLTFSRTTSTGGAMSSTFIFTDTAALYITIDALHLDSSSNPGKTHQKKFKTPFSTASKVYLFCHVTEDNMC